MKSMSMFLVLLILLVSNVVFAQSGLSILKTGHGAKQAGFGEAVVSISNQVDGTNYNPASINLMKKFTASFGHTKYWDNINLESAFYATQLTSKLNLHGGIRYAAVDEIEKRSIVPTEEPIGLFDFHDISIKTGVTYISNEKLSLGFAFGWFFEKNELWSGSALNIDLGMQYKLSQNMQLGGSITNLGSSFQLTADGEVKSNEISLPTRYAIGGSYQYNKYLGALDLVILDDDLKVHVGAEALVNEMFEVRAGYMLNYDSKNFSAGTSFTKRNIRIDYAFVPYSNDLGSTHLFNFTFSI